jgi:hypothetical protein
MDNAQLVVSMVGGGLAGGAVNVLFNRIFHWRSLRIKFYPKLSDMLSTYTIRMEDPQGRYMKQTVGISPSPDDDKFIRHRGSFMVGIVEFTELREARNLRRQILKNQHWAVEPDGTVVTTDLMPEYEAVNACMAIVDDKLDLS